MGHVGCTPAYTPQNDVCHFHNSVTVTYVWLMLYCIPQILFYRTSIKGFFSPILYFCSSHMSLSVTVVALPTKVHSIYFKL